MSDPTTDLLRAEISRLTTLLAERDAEIAALKPAVAKLEWYLRSLLQGRFGRVSEKVFGVPEQNQTLIPEIISHLQALQAAAATAPPTPAVEPAVTMPIAPLDAAASPTPPGPAKRKRGIRQIPSLTYPGLAVRESLEDLPEAERIDAAGTPLVRCGQEVTETIVVEPCQVFIARVVRPRYRTAEPADAAGRVVTSGVPVPERIVDGGILADATVHQIVVNKFADALPGNRTLEILARSGCRLSGSVVDGAVAACGDLLAPIAAAIRVDLRSAPVVGVDAANLKCRDRTAPPGTCRNTQISTITDGTQAWYRWSPDAKHVHGEDLLDGFHHWIIADAWDGWPKAIPIGGRLAGCWAHARRPFYRLRTADRDAADMVARIGQLYAIERLATDNHVTIAQRAAMRTAHAATIVAGIGTLADRLAKQHPGPHPCGVGARYIQNQWLPLTKFLVNPELRLDNNLAEGDLRPVALIRKNSLFLGAPSAGPRFAACLSVVRSCRLARIEPLRYLADITPALIEHRRLVRARLPAPDVSELTPYRWGLRHAVAVGIARES